MMLFDFGQPAGGIVQVAYTVQDIQAEAPRYSSLLGVGPWFIRGPFMPARARYRGQPTSMSITLARGFSGHIMVELVEQHNDAPSVYREVTQSRGYGFHHWAVGVPDFDTAIGNYERAGGEVAFTDQLPTGARIAYIDTGGALPGMVEVIEMNTAQEKHYTAMYREAVSWDGTRLLRGEPRQD